MGPWTSYLYKRDNYHLLSACLWQTLHWALFMGFICFPICAARGWDQITPKLGSLKGALLRPPPNLQAQEMKVIPKELWTRVAAQMS